MNVEVVAEDLCVDADAVLVAFARPPVVAPRSAEPSSSGWHSVVDDSAFVPSVGLVTLASELEECCH